ncbi:hypothetical protein D6C86_08837 [Aureobasidium pullulans]|uniref:Integral membrane protein n=1 Tax=Aureobasidium pullulans TaxID=5580 RepID=A0A4V4KTS0_AURPU|nr:hypothetical protein D6C94_09244 [Aureobasidium pullulans]THZ35947.1 hypothetical protein D6C87_09489 [Aureobasidium pullulans]THZ55181.1 hypothetical protein D6C86_08837 [Aureobasidium pullulans]THZ82703.1 hypothetical protein D6C88_06067 [Aureobasidium pullulans]
MSTSYETQQLRHGPPYASTTAAVGGRPTVHQDIPAIAVFLVLYLVGAISNMTIFQKNRRRGHKFLASWGMFGFCMARILSCVLRIVWTTKPHNVRLAIAAAIFLNLGVMVVYAVVLVLASRILRATQPSIGWNPVLRKAVKVSYAGIVVVVILVLSFTIANTETLDRTVRTVALWVQRGSNLYLLLLNCITPIFLLLSCLLPKDPESENFGSGSMASKEIILGVASFFCLFISGFRCGVLWATPRPASNPAWYDHKVMLYLVELGFEVVIIYLFLFTRFDKKFWVPNGSTKAGDYSERNEEVHTVVDKEMAFDSDVQSV